MTQFIFYFEGYLYRKYNLGKILPGFILEARTFDGKRWTKDLDLDRLTYLRASKGPRTDDSIFGGYAYRLVKEYDGNDDDAADNCADFIAVLDASKQFAPEDKCYYEVKIIVTK